MLPVSCAAVNVPATKSMALNISLTRPVRPELTLLLLVVTLSHSQVLFSGHGHSRTLCLSAF